MGNIVIRLIFIVSLGFILCSCGGGGSGPGTPGSDNTGEIGASLSVTAITHSSPAGDQGDQWQLDTEQGTCDAEPESWGDDFASVTISATSLDTALPSGELYIYRYTVEYTSQPAELNLPPIPNLDLTTLITIPADGSVTGNFLVLEWGTKTEFVEGIDSGLYNPSDSEPYLYDMKMTFYGQDAYGQEFSFTYHRTVMVGNYNNC
ncbi:MAG: hypothetical protein L3V56_05015 [Candidatus Magnetoovum sp. WYHC-5]|nr:hypothetical protein [Candidatus Magnetoovum sp. WYHC-5]